MLGSSSSLKKKRRCTVNLFGDAVHAAGRHNVGTISVEEQLLKGRQWARDAGKAEVIDALKNAATPWDERYRFTYWGAGITSTFTGSTTKAGIGNSTDVPFTEYAEGLAKYATEEINPKRDGLVVAHGLSRNGGSRDAECQLRTAFFADADEVGGSEEVLAALKETGLAFVMQDSGGSTPLRPRWHLEIPLAVPLVPPEDHTRWKKDVYRPQYVWLLGVFSELAGLSCNKGFDVSTTRLLQPVYPGCRRSTEASIPSTTWSNGLALNWDRLLSLSDYEAPPSSVKPRKVVSPTATTPAVKIDGHCLPLVRAFEVDGLVIHHRDGKTVVRCPTEAKHTTGTTGDTSTVILPGSREGTFHCSHGHCRRSAAQTEALLSPKARAVLLEVRAEAGVRRLQAQLAEQQQAKVKVATLDEVGREIARVIKAWTPGKLVVVTVTTGAGKSRAAVLALAEKARGNLDVDRGTVMIRQGKGRKDRLIPIGERALKWIDKYLTEERESLVTEPDDGWLFLSEKGTQLGHSYLGDVVRKYIDAAEIGKQGSCHLFRHTMATLMLEGGADIRFIQMMLGHEELTSTQIYTQVAINKLKEIHTATHPGAKLKVKKGAKETSAEVEAADLLEALAEESEEEESDEGE